MAKFMQFPTLPSFTNGFVGNSVKFKKLRGYLFGKHYLSRRL